MKESKLSEICNSLRNNPILQVFTKDYRDEIKYITFMEKNIDKIKLKSGSEDIDEKLARLKELGYESDFRIPLYEKKQENRQKTKIKTLNKQDTNISEDR